MNVLNSMWVLKGLMTIADIKDPRYFCSGVTFERYGDYTIIATTNGPIAAFSITKDEVIEPITDKRGHSKGLIDSITIDGRLFKDLIKRYPYDMLIEIMPRIILQADDKAVIGNGIDNNTAYSAVINHSRRFSEILERLHGSAYVPESDRLPIDSKIMAMARRAAAKSESTTPYTQVIGDTITQYMTRSTALISFSNCSDLGFIVAGIDTNTTKEPHSRVVKKCMQLIADKKGE